MDRDGWIPQEMQKTIIHMMTIMGARKPDELNPVEAAEILEDQDKVISFMAKSLDAGKVPEVDRTMARDILSRCRAIRKKLGQRLVQRFGDLPN